MPKSNSNILAVLGGMGTLIHAEHVAELACHLCEGRKAQLILTYPIIVPLALALDAPMPEQEHLAHDAIERGMHVAKQRGCDVQARIVRHRHAVDAVLELARAEHVDQIVLGVRINPKVIHDYDQADNAEDEIFRRAECEVIVDREPITEMG